MSHFITMVFGPDPERQLAPYHEFECTGFDDEFVVDVDETEEALEAYAEHTDTLYVHESSGESFEWGDARFYRDPTPEEIAKHGPFIGSGCGGGGPSYQSRDWGDGLGHRAKIRHVPEGYTEKELPTSSRSTFIEFCEDYYGRKVLRVGEPRTDDHKYGFVEVNDAGDVLRVVDRTNENKKWDYWVVGGRGGGWLRLKPGAKGTRVKQKYSFHEVIEKAFVVADRADIAMLGDVDFEAERDEKADEAGKNHDRWMAMLAEHPRPISWAHAREEAGGDIDKAREIYNAQPAIVASRRAEHRDFIPMLRCPVEHFGFDRAAYVERRRLDAMVPYAFVHESKWYGKGEMGWFGCSHDEKGTEEDWDRFFHDFVAKLPPDTLVTVVDCHI